MITYWHEITSDPDSYPDKFVRVLIVAYNKELNKSIVILAMYKGSYSSQHRWNYTLLTENKIEWHILDSSWEVTHWSLKTVPEEIDKLNKSKKVTEF